MLKFLSWLVAEGFIMARSQMNGTRWMRICALNETRTDLRVGKRRNFETLFKVLSHNVI